MDILTLEAISKTYQQHKALIDINLTISSGSIVGLLGPNGAGKTTLLRIITQILLPDTGKVLFKGNLLSKNDQFKFGYLPEERGLYKKMTVRDHLLFLAQLRLVPKDHALKSIKYWLQKFEIEERANFKIEELSKGMQQKIQLIAALLHDPEVIILDEPFTGFDPINEQSAQKVIKELNSRGVTFILSTHRMESVENYCSHSIFLNKGKIALAGSIKDIKSSYKENSFIVRGKGKLNKSAKCYLVLEHNSEEDPTTAVITLKDNHTKKDLLEELFTQIDILSFEEKLPGIEEIFRKVIKNA